MTVYDLLLTLAGVAALGAAALPRLLAERPLSMPIVYVAVGLAVFLLPIGVDPPDPLRQGVATERLAEITVIVALMGAGLKLERPLGWMRWITTWRLLAVTMPLTIAGAALLGWWWVGLTPAAALLLGAALAPTDPVLASDVQVAPPGEEPDEDEVRFSLTSEAGLNDGLAFPFVNAALAMAASGGVAWVGGWLALDAGYRVAVALLAGLVVGRVLGRLVFGLGSGRLAEASDGFVALAVTLLAYGVTELLRGYGFVAVFVAAVALRRYERHHEYHRTLHAFAEEIERLLTVALLVLFGGALAGGLLEGLTWGGAAVGLALLFVVRPLAGWAGLTGGGVPAQDRAAIAWFGIRGIGSFFYLAHALNEARFPGAERLWAIVGFTVLASVALHGVTASGVMRRLDRDRGRGRPGADGRGTEGSRRHPERDPGRHRGIGRETG
jgi:NhaP-type Na+/H+ or K+/H+ antiporter